MPRQSSITKDWFLLGFTGGVIGSVAKSLVNVGLRAIGVPVIRYETVAGSMILGRRGALWGLLPEKTRNRQEQVLGYIADTFLGGLFGAALAMLHVKTPPGHEFIKGVLAGTGLWAANLSLGNMLKLAGMTRVTPQKITTMLITNALFGGLQGLVFAKYGTQLIEQSHPQLVKNVSASGFHAGLRANNMQYSANSKGLR